MILTIDEIMLLPEFKNQDPVILQRILDAMESMIRKYTNNQFQNRHIRFIASSDGCDLIGNHRFFKIGDTIQITGSDVNNGLYVITGIDADRITVNKELFTEDSNLVTKIEYPIDLKLGVINLMKYDLESRKKIGIQSETISRHSVTYYNLDGNNTSMGYPSALMGFLKPYMKARF